MTTIRDLPLELHDHIKSYMPWRDQLKLSYLGKHIRLGSRLVEGKKQVENAFKKAIEKGADFTFIKQLLKHPDLDPSVDYNLAIQAASLYGHVDVVKVLLADRRSIQGAAQNGH